MGPLDLLAAHPLPTGIIVAGNWWATNPALGRLLDRRDLAGTPALAVVVQPDRPSLAARYRDLTGTHTTRWLRGDGSEAAVEVTSSTLDLEGSTALMVSARDLGVRDEREHAAAEAALHESEARYRLLFEGSPLAISVFDSTTFDIVAVNRKMTDVYGYSRDELLAMKIMDIKLPEDVAEMVANVSAAQVGTQGHIGVMRHRHKSGAMLDMDITSHQIMLDGRKCSLAIAIDVTEARKVEAQLRQSQKMDAIGQLAGGVAHDFNNLLSVILSAASFLKEELGPDHHATADVCDVEGSALRGAELTKQLLAFSRQQAYAPVALSLNATVAGVERLARRIVGEDIQISTHLAHELGTVRADAAQLEQVIMNLVVNARDAMPTGGKLVIETAHVDLGGPHAHRLGVVPGAYVMLSVTDTGCGMDDATRARIFEPFFTTKAVGRGTGLGLATVFGIVKQHDGAISVHSTPGKGATFRVYLPRMVHVAPRSETADPRPMPRRGSETILLVEDDSLLRRTVVRHLRAFGYRTVEAADPLHALDLVARTTPQIDLLLTDLVMPELDGRALALRMLAAQPSLKVLFTSGYSEHAAVKTGQLGASDHFIAKPFSAIDLSNAIRRALGDM